MNKLIVGLGNPGSKYERTRHNIGRDSLDYIEKENLSWKEKFKSFYLTILVQGKKTTLLKPNVYMNLSGEAVFGMSSFLKIDLKDILIVHDELDFDYGVIAFKKGGGFAGHNGLKSIGNYLKTPDFNRLRLGIGRPKYGDVDRWVLSKYSKDQEKHLENYFISIGQAISYFIEEGLENSFQKYNKRNLIEDI